MNKNKKNYIILGTIYFVVIILVLYLASIYNNYRKYEEDIPILKDIIPIISPKEIDHYITENPSTTLYFCSSNNKECREFEKIITSSLKNNNYENILYVNLRDILDTNEYMNDLLEKYGGKDYSIERIPCFIKFIDGKITSVLDGDNKTINKEEALYFLNTNNKAGQ